MDAPEADEALLQSTTLPTELLEILWGVTLNEDWLKTLGSLDPRSNQLSNKGLSNINKLGELKFLANRNWTSDRWMTLRQDEIPKY